MVPIVLALSFLLILGGCDDVTHTIMYEHRIVREGQFKGVTIGAKKSQVLAELQSAGVKAVKPAPVEEFVLNSRNIVEIDRIKNTQGIRLSGPNGFAIDLFFRNGAVWRVRKSVPARTNDEFKEGMDTEAVVKTVRLVLARDPGMEVLPIVYYEGNGWIPISESLDNARQVLSQYDSWVFGFSSDKPSGSLVKINFVDNRLKQIDYRRPRFKLK